MLTECVKEVSINREQELYCIPCGNALILDTANGGYSCLGFDVCIRWANDVAVWLRKMGVSCDPIGIGLRGTREAYDRYDSLMKQAGEYCAKNKIWCPCQLTPQLVGLEGKRVEVVDCYGQKRRFWVGRSSGWMKIHLEIATKRSSGGGAVTGTPFRTVRVIR